MNECTYEAIKNLTLSDACEYAKNCDSEYINFYAIHYCLFDQKHYFSIPFLIIFLLIAFYLLSDTSNRYLSSALTILSDKLKMSQNLAGVTLLALGNGAPDVISGIVASKGTLMFTLGSLMAGGVFVTCIVFSSVILFSEKVQLTRELFVRDILLYILAIIFLLLFSFNKQINIYHAIGFFSLYIINVVVALIQDIKSKKLKEKKKKIRIETNKNQEKDEKQEEIVNKRNSTAEEWNISVSGIPESPSDSESVNTEARECETISRALTLKVKNHFKNPITKVEDQIKIHRTDIENEKEFDVSHEFESEPKQNIEMSQIENNIIDLLKDDHFYKEENSQENKIPVSQIRYRKKRSQLAINLSASIDSIKYRLKRNYFGQNQSKWEDKGFLEKIFYVLIEFPLTYLRDITIPGVELEKWRRILFILSPLSSVLFVFLITNNIHLIIDYWKISIGVLVFLLFLSFIISKYTYRNRIPKCIILLCLFSFVMSILWIWAIANILVDILRTLGVIYPIPPTFLAMTLLSVGNSLPDLNLNCALAKSGYGEMGIAGSIAGPLFNLLIGLGTSLIIKTYKQGIIEFYFFDAASQTIVIAGSVLGLNLIRLLIQSIILKFNMGKSVSYIGYSFYVIFIVGISVFTFFPMGKN